MGGCQGEKLLDFTLEERVSQIERYLNDLRMHRDSRRGPEGPRGIQGESVQGPQGIPGKDADITEVIEIAKRSMQAELQTAASMLSQIVIKELKRSGVIDESGNAVLTPGPAGKDGQDGKSIVGPAGKDGVDGKSIVGPQVEMVETGKMENLL